MMFSLKDVESKIEKLNREITLSNDKINSIDKNADSRIDTINKKRIEDKIPYQEKIKDDQKEIKRLNAIKDKFVKLQDEFFGSDSED